MHRWVEIFKELLPNKCFTPETVFKIIFIRFFSGCQHKLYDNFLRDFSFYVRKFVEFVTLVLFFLTKRIPELSKKNKNLSKEHFFLEKKS